MPAIPEDRIYTMEDIKALPEGQRAELVDGRIYMMAPPKPDHERMIFQISRRIGNHIEEKNLPCEVLTSNVGVFLFEDDSTYLLPDLKVICDDSKMGDDGYHGAPEFIIEVLSPATKSRDMLQKLHWYWEAGVKEYWMIDIPKRLVYRHVFKPDYEHDIRSFDDDIAVSICPGFSLNLGQMGF